MSYRSTTASAAVSTLAGWRLRAVFGFLVFAIAATPFLEKELASALLATSAAIGLALGSINFFIRSRTLPRNERRAWRWFGAGIGLAAMGIVAHGATWVIASEVDAFGPFDLFWIAGYLVGIAGLAQLPHATGSAWQRIRLFLDGAIGAVAVGAILWATTLRDLTEQLGQQDRWGRFVGTAYIVLDALVLVVLMIVVVRRSSYRFDLRLVFIAIAAMAQGLADFAFLTSGVGRTFTEAEPIYSFNILAVTLFLATAVIVHARPEPREYAARTKTPAWAVVLPYGSAAVMVSLLVFRVPSGALNPDDAGLFYATLAIGGLVIARQAVAIRENRRLVDVQQTALVSSISHELRTPLTAMVGFLELLDGDEIDDEAERHEMTAIVNQQASYLSRIVSDLVMLASDNIAKMDLDVEPVAVDTLAWGAVNAAAIDSSSVKVAADKNIVAYVDRARIQQALANYLANAVRYGGDRIVVTAQANSGDLMMEVHDDGPGVPRKYELLIWEKFERGPNRLNASIPGSGIGLSVANAIAKAHGGAAGYRRSGLLGGACFWIRLPGRVHLVNPQPAQPSTRLSVVETRSDAQTA
ncbi:MAG: HAMP domain-containing sensor histidine kinase [Acidimicrobiia bacterium]|nr:HAMP domain-containing sensor histidine kinase [Acidimicrobiia bacterium]